MKQEIKPATGRLGVLVVGVGGAVATTMIVGTLASRKGLAKPIGSITQLATMRMENNEEKLIKDVVPLTDLNDIVFGGWDIFPDNAYEAAMYAEVLKEKDLNGVKDELEAIKPMPAAFEITETGGKIIFLRTIFINIRSQQQGAKGRTQCQSVNS